MPKEAMVTRIAPLLLETARAIAREIGTLGHYD
ncbi:Uncharacterised protein [Mycobacterium tuberculosis]|nr:Uncharacterised protein [Mycobacterium tuberculosis]